MARVLVVEDDEVATNLCKILLDKQHTLLKAYNTDQALNLLKENHIDLIITDLMVCDSKGIFPNSINSLKFIEALRSIDKKVKIIVYSALCFDVSFQKQVIVLGANVCLAKIGSVEVFKRTIQDLLGVI